MDTKKYEALLTAVQLGSFSAAAEALGYTPAGISLMADAVETGLGIKLLNRGHNGVSLTSSGEAVIHEIREILNHERLLEQYCSDLKGCVTGSVTIGAYYSIATHWLPNLIRDFSAAYPGIRITLREGGHAFLTEWMQENSIDFGMMSREDPALFQWLPLKKDRMVIVAPAGHPLSERTSVSLKEAAAYPFIMPSMGRDFDVANILRAKNIRLDIRYSTVESYSAIALVESGMGISMMNELITLGLNRNIVRIPLEPEETLELGVAYPKSRPLSPAAKRLIDFIRVNDCFA